MLLDDNEAIASEAADPALQESNGYNPETSPSVSESDQPHKYRKLRVQLILFLINALLLVTFFSLGANKTWFRKRIITYWEEFVQQKEQLDPEHRMAAQFGNKYTVSRSIAGFFKKYDNVLLLMPPTEFLKLKGIDYKVPEPAVFYYYTGLKTTWADSKKAAEANWYLRVMDHHQLTVSRISSERERDSILAIYRQYKTSL